MSRQSSERLRGFRPDDRGRQQKAADAGAVGAAHENVRGRTDLVTLGARNYASENGFTHYELPDPDPDVTVTVTYPYTYNGGTDFVEVFIEGRNVPRILCMSSARGRQPCSPDPWPAPRLAWANETVHEAESPDRA